jgi:hypothetical protein
MDDNGAIVDNIGQVDNIEDSAVLQEDEEHDYITYQEE